MWRLPGQIRTLPRRANLRNALLHVKLAAFIEALRKHFRKSFGHVFTTRIEPGKSAGICEKHKLQSVWPPVEMPIAMNAIRGNAAFPFFLENRRRFIDGRDLQTFPPGALCHFDLVDEFAARLRRDSPQQRLLASPRNQLHRERAP